MAETTRRCLCALLLLVVLLLVTPLAFAQTTAPSAAPVRIAFLNPGKHDEFFWPAVSSAMQAAADQFGYELEVVYAERDAQAIGALGHRLIDRPSPPDVLILVNEFQVGSQLLRAAEMKGIKTFMLLNSFYGAEAERMGKPGEKFPHWIGSLIPDNKAAGRRMGAALANCVRKGDRRSGDHRYHIFALLGDSTTPASIDRTAGFRDSVGANPDLFLDRALNTNWQAPKGQALTLNFLDWIDAQELTLAGIFAANDALALGAIAAAAERGLEPGKDFCIVGLNWSPEALTLVQQGKMVMSDGGHFLAGGWAMVMIHDYLEQGSTPRAGQFQMAPIDSSNVADFIAELGDRDWRRIDFKNFSNSGGDYNFSLREALRRIHAGAVSN